MSEEESGESSTAQLLSTEFKNGHLEIVEVASFSKGLKLEGLEGHVLAEGSENSVDGDGDMKYMQVLDTGKATMMDLLNFTLVRCEDGQESYQLVSNAGSSDDNDIEATVTCVLQSGEDGDEQEETYVMVDGAEGPLVFLQQTSLQKAQPPKPAPTLVQTPETAKPLQKAKSEQAGASAQCPAPPASVRKKTGGAGAAGAAAPGRGGARRRRGELPPPHELLASPHFKLFLYSCKLCSFRCNAIKELTAHKAAEHSGGGGAGGGRGRGGWRSSTNTLQCARCPFRGCTHMQLMRHVQEKHAVEKLAVETTSNNKVYLDSAEVEAADVLVCGACGYETASRVHFKRHIQQEHGADPC